MCCFSSVSSGFLFDYCYSQFFYLFFCLRICKGNILHWSCRCNDRLELSIPTCNTPTCISWAQIFRHRFVEICSSHFIRNFQIILVQPVLHQGRVAQWNNREVPSSKTKEVLRHNIADRFLVTFSWNFQSDFSDSKVRCTSFHYRLKREKMYYLDMFLLFILLSIR